MHVEPKEIHQSKIALVALCQKTTQTVELVRSILMKLRDVESEAMTVERVLL